MIPLAGIFIGILIIAALFAKRDARKQPRHSEALSNKELIDTMDRLNRMALERNNGGPHAK